MIDLQVYTGCTRPAGLLNQYREQLRAARIPLFIDTIPEPDNAVGSFGQKVRGLRKVLNRFGDCRKLVITDAWDVLFYGTADQVYSKIPDDSVILGAERNCWPDAYLAPHFKGETPWRFVNGGLLAGTPERISEWLDEIETHPCYHAAYIDQQWFNHRRIEGSYLTPIDSTTELFYCMALEAGELQCENGIPVNTICETRPNFIHFNGKTDPTMFLWKYAISLGMIK